MKINEKSPRKECELNELEVGDVFFCTDDDPDNRLYLLRTDEREVVAVSLETGCVYRRSNFSSEERFIVVEAEVNILG